MILKIVWNYSTRAVYLYLILLTSSTELWGKNRSIWIVKVQTAQDGTLCTPARTAPCLSYYFVASMSSNILPNKLSHLRRSQNCAYKLENTCLLSFVFRAKCIKWTHNEGELCLSVLPLLFHRNCSNWLSWYLVVGCTLKPLNKFIFCPYRLLYFACPAVLHCVRNSQYTKGRFMSRGTHLR
jgi:hypothetical protein